MMWCMRPAPISEKLPRVREKVPKLERFWGLKLELGFAN